MSSIAGSARPVALALLVVLACAGTATAQDPTDADDPVVARINGAEVHRSELETAHAGLPEQYRELPLDLLFDPLLDQAIDSRLLADQAAAAKFDDDPEFQHQLARAHEQLAREFVLRAEVDRVATDEALRTRYDEFLAANPPEEQVRASHILVATEAEAEAIAAELAAGADFTELARAKSIDPSAAQNGGDLGFFAQGDMVPEFAAAAFALEPGQTSAPIKTAFGWHVIRQAERRAGESPAFEDVREQLRGEFATEIIGAYLTRLRADAVVERFNLDGSPRAEPVAQ
ncbi:MAG: peptidylprolyl isomerase [Alphaproteobacteria bacterium]